MMRKGARTGIVGAGLMGRWHSETVQRLGGQVVAIADPDELACRSLKRRCKEAELFSDGEALLAGVDLDVVHICTPLETHLQLAELALARGVSVLIEKPMTSDLAGTLALLERAREAKVQIAPVHQFPFQRGFRRTLGAIEKAGAIRHVEFCICSAGGTGQAEARLRALVADVIPHPLSVSRALLGNRYADIEWKAECPDAGELRLHGRANGSALESATKDIAIEVLVSFASRPTENSLRIRGDHGTFDVDFFHGYSFFTPGGVSRRRKITLPFERAARSAGSAALNLARRIISREQAYPGLRTLVSEFYGSLNGDCAPPISPQEIEQLARSRDEILAQLAC